MSIGFRVSRAIATLELAQKASLRAYLVPQKEDTAKLVEISGSGLVVPYNIAQNVANLTTKPPRLVCNGALSTATTPVLAANRPTSFTVQLWAQVTNTPGAYAAGTTPASDTFIRTAVGDLRAYVIASDGGGNFLISSDQTPALGTWQFFTITAIPNLIKFYLGSKLVASVAKTARADANFAYKYNWSSGNHVLGASLLYTGVGLSANEVAQNFAYLKARHGY